MKKKLFLFILGRTKVLIKIKEKPSGNEVLTEAVPITVIRKKRVIDVAFTASVATLVSIIYINFGCALNWGELKTSLKKPIGPIIGCIGQFIFMPVVSVRRIFIFVN